MNTEQRAAFYNNAAELPLNNASTFIRACSSIDLPRRGFFISKLLLMQDRIAAFREDKIPNRGDVTGCAFTR